MLFYLETMLNCEPVEYLQVSILASEETNKLSVMHIIRTKISQQGCNVNGITDTHSSVIIIL
jgi:hypothetical protein